MDAKITKKRLSDFLSYDWLKMVGIAVGFIVVWALVFTTTATRIIPSQSFGIYTYKGALGGAGYIRYAEMEDLSYEVIKIDAQDSMKTAGDDNILTIMETRLAVDEIDVAFTSDAGEGFYQYQTPEGETKKTTCLEDFIYRYYGYTYRLDGENGYLAGMAAYLNTYYGENYQTGELDKAKVESDFLARIKANKDKRYKKQAEINEGIKGEIERITAYRNSLVEFYGYLEKGYISLTEKTLYMQNHSGEIQAVTGVYSINLCPNDKMKSLVDDVYYYVEDEETGDVKTAANMNIVLVREAEVESGFEYEKISFVNHIVRKHCSDLQVSQ